MTWHLTEDVAEFELATKEFLLADPVGNTVLLTVAAILAGSGADAYGTPPRLGWYQREGEAVQGAFLRTPPRPALVSALPDHAVAPLLAVDDVPSAFSGPAGTVAALADSWTAAAPGRRSTVAMRQRLYRLSELTPPSPMPEGGARIAGLADLDLLLGWFDAFAADIGSGTGTGHSGGTPANLIEDRVRNELLLLWEVDGVPVSLAGVTLPAGGTVRVAPVYTPPALRGRGYAGAATAEISRRIRAAGHEAVLFTDLANPTSNALYQRIGYREVQDYTIVQLER
ncbi:MAG: GNAT family N-acetyltransferase [Catenulispora sp.]|nr:GNAT family N-acetyltransferase [Catenulispora sp.]